MKKLFLGIIFVFSVITWTAVQAAETEEAGSIPDWLKRTSYGISIETDQKPRVYIETVQPLYQDPDKIDTIFTHGRITYQDKRGTYGLGLGYRRLLFDEELLAGINTFFDFQDLNKHYRAGLGLEAIGKLLEGRFNTYFGISPKRTIWSSSGTARYEKVVDGFDIELGAPVPYFPWLKLFGSYYQYDFKKFKDKEGWKLRGEIKPLKCLTINLETYDDNKGPREYRIDTRFSLAFDSLTPASIISAFKLTEEPFSEVDLKEHTLDRVERNFNIQVESWIESATTTIEIKRGD